ncbi:MAG TPA: tRNA (adenosine(37)-N6)-threonylcarbamoyltransferase complex transferase subunit TsaD [Candidatus Aveggerthella excrementigallinarum]|nr:tRNA (adenosine(37)-N6)-threonylcarbamoyltransferase complex transferase subunit TsaD [Candidatus Aveggerthella excrementigallinarum]
MEQRNIVLAFDTANEVIAIGVGELDEASRTVRPLAHEEVAAHRASNTQLVPRIDALLAREGIARGRIACVACGRGPGSFTGVRICMATAKGIASALDVPLWGVSSLDAIAWQLQAAGVRGAAAVAADAMRKEVYPVRYELSDEGVARQNEDCVLKAADAAAYLAKGLAGAAGVDAAGVADRAGAADDANVAGATSVDFPSAPNTAATIAGDALRKYADLFEPLGAFAEEGLWTPTGEGLLLAFQAAWRTAGFDALDAQAGNPAFALPVYTRLSDAEENERIRLAKNDPKNLTTGVQESEAGLRADQRRTIHDAAILNAQPDEHGVVYKPLDAAHAAAVAALEARAMGTDAWNEALVLDELPRRDRVWWAAYVGDVLAGYVGTWVVDGQMQVLKIAVEPTFRRRGIARELLARAAADARDLGASEATLEVRASNEGAQALYAALGFRSLGVRPRYYSDREGAVIMSGPLPLAARDVAGMRLQEQAIARDQDAGEREASSLESAARRPLILAIESSCDETAAAIIDGAGTLLSDVVASQIDFHARFGGVVPEIASRKHIEAICGVTQEALDVAARQLAVPCLRWRDLDAVAVTYAPGLVGALVVGVAFAKGAAWGADVPFIGVNHMEGHLYANKIATPDIKPPMVVSLVSGGHTMLVLVKAWGDYETLGQTIDDAVGEAFDKVAKALGLGYPGGPVISKLAAQGDPKAIDFPRALLHSHDLRFSLSGLKTAVTTYLNKERAAGRELNLPDIAASFQAAVVDVQVAKAKAALLETGAKEFCLGGGVAANPALRAAYERMCEKIGVRLTMPPLSACGDNAGMIALVALDRYRQGKFFGLDADAHAHASLDEPY